MCLLFNDFVGQEYDVLRRASVIAEKADGLSFFVPFFGYGRCDVSLALSGEPDDGHTDHEAGCYRDGYPTLSAWRGKGDGIHFLTSRGVLCLFDPAQKGLIVGCRLLRFHLPLLAALPLGLEVVLFHSVGVLMHGQMSFSFSYSVFSFSLVRAMRMDTAPTVLSVISAISL